MNGKINKKMSVLDKIYYKLIFVIKMVKYTISYKRSFTVGKDFSFRKRLTINVNGGGKLKIGNHVFFNNDCSINCKMDITIGDYCIFGENVKIYDHNHRFSDYIKPIKEQGYKTKSIYIGENCWIGSNVVILPGTYIRSNSIIGAGCVITGDIPEGVIVISNRELQYEQRGRNDE